MSFLNSISRLVQDPPPSHLFELSEAGLAFAYNGQNGFLPFEPGTLVASPVADNLLRPDVVAAAVDRVAPMNGSKKRRPAALILPDYSARVTVLDFDSFPASAEEQLNLVRFRVKKTIPFDIDSAAVSYYVQPASGSKKVDVVAVIMALEVIARYEALFRRAGFHPGMVTISALAALNLHQGQDVAVLAKLANRVLSVAVLAGSNIKLFRCVALEEATEEEIEAVLQPTFAYVEDELGTPARRLILCGLPLSAAADLECETRPLRGRYVSPGPFNAGLLGYLEGMEG
jgi:type IV pilus assembly protein PilM